MADKTTKSVKSGKKTGSDSSTQRYLPFTEIRDNCMIMKDGSSRMVLRVRAVNFSLKSTEEQDALIIGYQRFLNTLRFPIQILVRSLKVDLESYVAKLNNLALKQENRLLQDQTYRYIEFLNNLIDLAQIMRKEFYIIVPYDYEQDLSVRNNSMFGVFQNFWKALQGEDSVTSVREKRRKAEDLKKKNTERMNSVKGALDNIGMKSEEVKKDELIRLLMDYYDPRLGGNPQSKMKVDSMQIV